MKTKKLIYGIILLVAFVVIANAVTKTRVPELTIATLPLMFKGFVEIGDYYLAKEVIF